MMRRLQLAEAMEAAAAKGPEEEAHSMAEVVKEKERTIAALQLQVRTAPRARHASNATRIGAGLTHRQCPRRRTR